MSGASSKLEQALRDLVEAFVALEEETEEKFGDDELSYSAAIVEALEPAIENAIEDIDLSTTTVATLIDALTEALESLDPNAFESNDDEDLSNYNIEDIDIDDDDEDDDDDEEIDLDDPDD